jgi:hypothetical protein
MQGGKGKPINVVAYFGQRGAAGNTGHGTSFLEEKTMANKKAAGFESAAFAEIWRKLTNSPPAPDEQ